jgi:tRNA(fMet)-specific endonuclease VapC
MSFLVDTDICSAHMKGNRQVTNRFLHYTGNLYISVVSLGERAHRKNAPSRRMPALLAFLNDVHVLEVSSHIAEKFGEVRANLMDQGLPAPDLDLLVAATALVHNLIVVTHNTADYLNISNLQLVDGMIP